MVAICAVFGCSSKTYLLTYKDKRQFFRFPKEESRCRQWLKVIGRPDLMTKDVETLHNGYRICDAHFEDTYRLLKRLTNNAIPTLKLAQKETAGGRTDRTQTDLLPVFNERSIKYSTSVASQTPQYFISDTPLKRKLLSDVENECKKAKNLEEQLRCSPIQTDNIDVLSPKFQNIINLQKKLKFKTPGNGYEKEFKNFSLNLYLFNPLAYKTLQKKITLPCETTLRHMVGDIGTRMNSSILTCLKSKIEKHKELDKYCVICADVMPLKMYVSYQIHRDKIIGLHEINGIQEPEPATLAFVLMARGISSEWNQPLGYCLLSQNKMYDELRFWIIEVIASVLSIGFKVVAFVSDDGPIFSSLANYWRISLDKPYFNIDEHKIYYIYDVPYLIKSLRNNLLKYDFRYILDGATYTASWHDINTLYKQDRKRQYKLAPKLTKAHIDPSDAEKVELRYATEVLSRTVTAAMSCSLELKQLNKKSIGTIKFIEMVNNTFDILNSSNNIDGNKYKEFAGKKHQKDTLDQFSKFLTSATVCKQNNKPITDKIEFLEYFKITLKNIQNLAQDLKVRQLNCTYTRRLNLDSLHNFFDSVRQLKGYCKLPTSLQFSPLLQKLFIVNMLEYPGNDHCSDLLEQLFQNIDGFKNVLTPTSDDNLETLDTILPLQIDPSDYQQGVTGKNSFLCLCDYLLKKCYDLHKCDTFTACVKSTQYTEAGIKPPQNFQNLIKQMDEKLVSAFENAKIHGVGVEILKQINEISFDDAPCSCFPTHYLKKVFILLRIFNIIQVNNAKFFSEGGKEATTFTVSSLS